MKSTASFLNMMQGFITILYLFWMASSCSSHILEATGNTFNVLDYGAVGDGKTDSSQSFLKAWQDFCQASSATLVVPAGEIFLLNPIVFNGPCQSGNPHIQIDGTIIAPTNIDAWGNDNGTWIQFSTVNYLIVDGKGQIDGQGDIWWKACKDNADKCSRPTALNFHNCNGLQLSGLTHINSQRNHISINDCNGVDIFHLHITAPEDSPNTDGIDISKSSHMNIWDSIIATGDDCIAINGFSNYINISGITCGPGHGISVGSLGKDGAYENVEEVQVQNCTFIGTQNGVRIKTWKGGSGYVKNVTFEDITLLDVQNPIIIDQNYNNLAADGDGEGSGLVISDITYRDVNGTCVDENAITLDCFNIIGCTNIVMENVNIIPSKPGQQVSASCNNASGVCIAASPNVPCLSAE